MSNHEARFGIHLLTLCNLHDAEDFKQTHKDVPNIRPEVPYTFESIIKDTFGKQEEGMRKLLLRQKVRLQILLGINFGRICADLY